MFTCLDDLETQIISETIFSRRSDSKKSLYNLLPQHNPSAPSPWGATDGGVDAA